MIHIAKIVFSFFAMVESSTGWSRARAGKMASGWRKTKDMAMHQAKLYTSSHHTRSLEHSLHSIRYNIEVLKVNKITKTIPLLGLNGARAHSRQGKAREHGDGLASFAFLFFFLFRS
jgi:hypothetical protein